MIKGEYGHTPVAIDPAFRELITGSPEEKAYDVASYRKPENPVLEEFDGVKLAANDEENLLLELLPSVAVNFLKKRRREEYEAEHAAEIKEANEAAEAAAKEAAIPVTGPTISARWGAR